MGKNKASFTYLRIIIKLNRQITQGPDLYPAILKIKQFEGNL